MPITVRIIVRKDQSRAADKDGAKFSKNTFPKRTKRGVRTFWSRFSEVTWTQKVIVTHAIVVGS
jgi:hypothetical protein